jgi:hypothetical protein
VRRDLQLTHAETELVLYPGTKNDVVEVLRVTVHGKAFPQRALLPELVVGEASAERVSIAPDRRSIRGYLRDLPPDGASIVVRYGHSQEGSLRKAFRREHVRPLPKGC